MKMRHSFTLLEVITALVILSLGATALLWQLSAAAGRMLQNEEAWQSSHELAQAAEFLLLYGPQPEIAPEYLSGDYQVKFRYEDPNLSAERHIPVQGHILKKLHLQLWRDHELVDAWELECFVEEQKMEK